MKSKFKRISKSTMSVILSLCMIMSCMTVGLIATDAAKVTGEPVGSISAVKLKGSWDGWNVHTITDSYKDLTLAANTDYQFVLMDQNGAQYHTNQTYNNSVTGVFVNKNDSGSMTLHTTIAGTYRITHQGYDGGGSSIKMAITYPEDPSSVTWSVTGDNTALFGGDGTNWPLNSAANNMTPNNDYSVYTWTKNAVTLTADNFKYKVVKNHSWDVCYPSGDSNQTSPSHSAGVYNVTITYTRSPENLTINLTPVPPHNLTIASNIAGAEVTASYGGNTISEGSGTLSVPETMKASIVADTGVEGTVVKSITATGGATVTGSGKLWKLTMGSADSQITAVTTGPAGTKRVYFNNANTKYSQVRAYTEYAASHNPGNGATGTLMTKMSNSNIYYIDVPEDIDKINFIGGNGAETGLLDIPWGDYDNPKYTAGEDPDDPSEDGTWGDYKPRDNVYTISEVTNNSSSTTTLFTGIKATMYDYYVDNEVRGGWLTGITASGDYNCSGNTNDPFRSYLNKALSDYADDTNIPKNDITYPLYFGNNKDSNKGTLYNFSQRANNSDGLGSSNRAIYGLTGTALTGGATGTIQHYKSSVNNENGASMAFFDEDFLSGENSTGETLATIIHSNSFPVRQFTEGGGYDSVWLNENGQWNGSDDHGYIYAWVWGSGKTSKWVKFTNVSGSIYKATGVSGYTKMTVCSLKTENVSDGDTTYGSPDIAYSNHIVDNITFDFSDKAIFKLTSYNAGSFTTHTSETITSSGGHTYYEYDSTGGKDNAFVTNINTTDHTAKLDYYANSAQYVQSQNSIKGFFPFDYNNIIGNTGSISTSNYKDTSTHKARDLGFGLKLEIPFRLDKYESGGTTSYGMNSDGTAQEFRFSGDDDLWVFIDGNLVLDLGGAHAPTSGTINFNTMEVTTSDAQSILGADSSTPKRNQKFGKQGITNGVTGGWFDNTKVNVPHTMTIYYTERGMFDSNLKFGFSFRTLPSQYKTEKKIRTTGRDTDNPSSANYIPAINSGFYRDNGVAHKTGDAENPASNYAVDLSDSWNRDIYKFERSYQSEQFAVTHKSSLAATGTGTGGKVVYSIGENEYELAPDTSNNNAITYNLKNDEIAYFLAQYAAGSSFTLSEDANPSSANKYRYIKDLAVYDDGNNEATISRTESNGNYTFTYDNTSHDNINIRARFLNYMKSHDLNITKAIDNATDPDAEFTIQVLFNFEGENYVAYPLDCTLNGTAATLTTKTASTEPGTIKIKAGDNLVIPNIPENAKVQIKEIDYASTFSYSSTALTHDADADHTSTLSPDDTVTNGVKFTIPTDNVYAVFHNTKAVQTVKVKKVLTGSNDTTTTFPINIKIKSTGSSGAFDATYTYSLYDNSASSSSDHTDTPATASNGITVNLAADDYVEFALPVGAYVTVNEPDFGSTGTYALFDYNSTTAVTYEAGGTTAYSSASNSGATSSFTVVNAKNADVIVTNVGNGYDVTITKDIDNDDALGTLQNRRSYFPIRVQTSTDGSTFVDYSSALSGKDYNNDTVSAAPIANYKDASGNDIVVHSIRQGDVLSIPDLAHGTTVKVTELAPTDIQEGSENGKREAFETAFSSALENYNFKSASAAEKTSRNDVGTASGQYVSAEINNEDIDFTITNEAILYTVMVKKLFSDFDYEDDSEFDLTIAYNPTGALTEGTYQDVTNGTLSETITSETAKTGQNGVYTVKKNGYVTFTGIPKGTMFKVNETRIGNSPVTGAQRFEFDKMELSTGVTVDHNDNGHYFSVKGADAAQELTLNVYNKVFKSWTAVTKYVSPADDVTEHSIKLTVKENGASSAALENVQYRSAKNKDLSTTSVPSDTAFSIVGSQTIYLYYPLGSYITVEEVQPGAAGYMIDSINATGVKASNPAPVYSKTYSFDGANNKVAFQTIDNNDAVVTITNKLATLNKYEFTYRYKSRHLNSNSTDENDRVYGEQTFTSKGEITAEELAEYFEVNGSTSFNFKDDVIVDGKVTKSYKQEFIAAKSPYEKNFKEKITWNFSAATVKDAVYDSTNKYWTIKTDADVTADYDYDPKLSAEFDLPYEYYDPTTTTSIVPGENDGVIPVTEQVTIGEKTTDIVRKSNGSRAINFSGNAADDNIMRARFLKWVTLNEIKSLEDLNNARATNPNAKALFIKAPESIYDNQDNEYVFRYWSMKDLEEIEYAKCYSNEFNMALYQSSIIEPIYELKTGGNASQLEENAAFDANNKMATIAFLENSRMQWNENGGGSKISDDLKHYSGDKLVTDFALAFDYKGLELRSKNNYAFGVVVEKLEGGEIDPNNVPTNAQLTAEHKNDDLTAAKNAVQAELVSKIYDNMVEGNKINKSYFSSDNANKYQISSSPTKNTLDNKNELEYYFAMDKFTNSYVDESDPSKGITSTETGLHLNKYRAFSFLMVPCKTPDSETVELKAGTGLYVKFIISDPVYFTNYTEASISNGATN